MSDNPLGTRVARDPEDQVARDDTGGDPACWLSRGCPTCGQFTEGPTEHCPSCDAP